MRKFLLSKFMLLLSLMLIGAGSVWGETYTLTISPSDFNTTSYAANNNEKTSEAVCTTDNTKKMDVKWTSYQIMLQSSAMQWQKSKGYIYNSTDLGTITSVTVNSTSGSFTTYYGTTEHPTSGTTVGNGFFTVKVGSETGKTTSIEITFSITSSSTPSIVPSQTEIEVTADEVTGESFSVTYNNLTIDDGDAEVHYFESDGTTQLTGNNVPGWIVANIDSNNDFEYMIEENTSTEARTAYMKIYALDAGANAVYSPLITITQAGKVTYTNYTLASSITSGKHYIIVGKDDSKYYAMGSQTSNNRAQVEISVSSNTANVSSNSAVSEFVIYGPNEDGNYSIYDDGTGYLYAASSSSNYLRSQSKNNSNGLWKISFANTGVATIVSQGSFTRNTMRYNSGSDLFSCYESGNQNDVYLYVKDGEAPPTESVTISDANYATYSSENALDFSGFNGVTVYTAKVNGSNVTLTEVEGKKVPASVGVVLKGKGTYEVPTVTGEASTISDNELLISDGSATTTSSTVCYALANKDSRVGFYKVASGVTIPKGKAYLSESSGSVKEFLAFDETTGIRETIGNDNKQDVIYNLAGQRVNKATRGLYIVNGKKVLVK